MMIPAFGMRGPQLPAKRPPFVAPAVVYGEWSTPKELEEIMVDFGRLLERHGIDRKLSPRLNIQPYYHPPRPWNGNLETRDIVVYIDPPHRERLTRFLSNYCRVDYDPTETRYFYRGMPVFVITESEKK